MADGRAVRIQLVAVGDKPPRWVREGFNEYAKRLAGGWKFGLTEVAPGGRGGVPPMEQEGERLLRAVPKGARVVALAVEGESWSTEGLARRLDRWSHEGRQLALVVGGADGLGTAVFARADTAWSLSALTLPHMLVRVVVAEQIYRAWTVLSGHPYHRG